jgi:hypothetical protein
MEIKENYVTEPQPDPNGGKINIWPLVMQDIKDRVDSGIVKYGTVLQSHNGRDALLDAYQEAIDLVFYLRQMIVERDETT